MASSPTCSGRRAICRALGSAPAGFAIWRDRSVTYDSLAVVDAESKQMPKAGEALLASGAVVARMAAQHPDSPQSKQELTRLDQQLAAPKN
jgi:hypothetical protein